MNWTLFLLCFAPVFCASSGGDPRAVPTDIQNPQPGDAAVPAPTLQVTLWVLEPLLAAGKRWREWQQLLAAEAALERVNQRNSVRAALEKAANEVKSLAEAVAKEVAEYKTQMDEASAATHDALGKLSSAVLTTNAET
jgi:hypothetical protein